MQTFAPTFRSDIIDGISIGSFAFNTTAVASLTDVPVPPTGGYPISIAGRNYMVDTSFEPYRREAFRHKSIAPQRQSMHFTNIPDDGTVSTEGLWRREARDWRLGAGQIYFDRKGSDDARYYRSKGIDPWQQWQATLLPDVIQQTAASTATKSIRVGQYVYMMTSTTLSFLSSWSASPTAVTNLPGSITILDICTDGYNVYVLHTKGVSIAVQGVAAITATNKLFVDQSASSPSGGLSFTANLSTLPLTGMIEYAGDRLIMVLNNVASWDSSGSTKVVPGAQIFDLSNHVSGKGLEHTHTNEWIYTHPNLSWKFTGIAGGSSQIYVAGHNVNVTGSTVTDASPGAVFRMTIAAGTSSAPVGNLTYPVVALPFPAGEYPTAIRGYLNYVFIGTNKGIRMCQTLNGLDPSGASGDLKSGPLIPDITQIPSLPVTAIVGYDRYIYWAWNNYDNTSTGLGRLDLTSFIDNLAPAYASDLMITGQGTINWLSWDPITDTPLISVNTGTYKTYTGDPNNVVASGNIDSGLITYGIPDFKNAVSLDVGIENIVGGIDSSVAFSMDIDDTSTLSIGSYSGSNRKASLGFPQQFGEQYRINTTLNACTSQAGTRVTPTLNRWTLKALPGIPSGILISAVLLMYEPLEMEGQTIYMDPYTEYAYLEQLRQSQQVVTYVEGPFEALVTVDLIDWMPERRRAASIGGYHGNMVVTLKTVTG